ncbi:hypothetical protein [Ensifer adhaerens]|uniref:hypothetical protein n=1 Tax=Ensifer adhaerens TaxID=106592 RepID=UPI000DC20373|nr:hypothetical protein [Ensifer adhaerens]RAS13940.1 hypothetical protein DEU52_10554 [Ensifer adhaerens]
MQGQCEATAPFWKAAKDLLSIKPEDVLALFEDIDERYDVELDINRRKSYLRDDPMVVQLSSLMGYDTASMDHLWMFVQENYK